jgi:hypothetical protein
VRCPHHSAWLEREVGKLGELRLEQRANARLVHERFARMECFFRMRLPDNFLQNPTSALFYATLEHI